MAKKKIEMQATKEGIDLLRVMRDIDGYKIEPITEEEIKEKKSNPLFEIIDAIFRNKGYINNMTDVYLRRLHEIIAIIKNINQKFSAIIDVIIDKLLIKVSIKKFLLSILIWII